MLDIFGGLASVNADMTRPKSWMLRRKVQGSQRAHTIWALRCTGEV